MKCPFCKSKEVEVIEFKDGEDTKTRVYGCNGCRKKFMTVERILTADRRRAE